MKSISGKQFAKILEHHGWYLARISGSHHIYKKPGKRESISLPIHGNNPLKMGLLNHFIKIAELTESEL